MLESLFNKVAGLRPATLLKKSFWRWCFPVNFAKFLKTLFLKEHLWTTASVGTSSKEILVDVFQYRSSNRRCFMEKGAL